MSEAGGALLRGEPLLRLGFLAEQPHEEPDDRSEEDERLLGRHEDPAEVLILLRPDAPEPLGQRLVVVVDRRRERQRKAEERREDERGEHVADPGQRRDRARHVAQHGPPEEQADRDQEGVLEREEVRVAHGGVVHGAEVDDVPAHEPDRQGDRGPGQPRERPASAARERRLASPA